MSWLRSAVVAAPALALAGASVWLLGQAWSNFQSVPTTEFVELRGRNFQSAERKKVSTALEFRPTTLSGYRETIARPLFESTRRYPNSKTRPKMGTGQAQVKPATPIESLEVAGVITQGHAQFALVRSPSNPSGSWHGLSALVDGWKILEISIDSVKFRNGTQEKFIHIYGGAGSKTTK